MEIKKTIKDFVADIMASKEEVLNDNNGFLLLAYEKQGANQENCFCAGGKMNNLAECLYSCMQKDYSFASVILAATNAYAQNKMMEAKMAEEAAQPKKKRKTKKQN